MISDRKNAVSFTERGFANYGEFEDARGNRCCVRESSSATQNAVWIFIDECEGQGGGKAALHLVRGDVERLKAALDRWLADEAASTTAAPQRKTER